jgi:hypothetical protein
MNMNEFRRFYFSLVRYVPDPARDEAVNLGVILVSDDEGTSAGSFVRALLAKIRPLDPYVNPSFVKRYLLDLEQRLGASHQAPIGDDTDRIRSVADLRRLSASMRNLFQLTQPKLYRSVSLESARQELFSELVSVKRPALTPNKGMSRAELKRVISRTMREWTRGTREEVRIKANDLERAGSAQHFADFWVQNGHTLAALIAIPASSEERAYAWAVRDSVPTIAHEFQELYPNFVAVAVFPPREASEATDFVRETTAFLSDREGVLVSYADELSRVKNEILPEDLFPPAVNNQALPDSR